MISQTEKFFEGAGAKLRGDLGNVQLNAPSTTNPFSYSLSSGLNVRGSLPYALRTYTHIMRYTSLIGAMWILKFISPLNVHKTLHYFTVTPFTRVRGLPFQAHFHGTTDLAILFMSAYPRVLTGPIGPANLKRGINPGSHAARTATNLGRMAREGPFDPSPAVFVRRSVATCSQLKIHFPELLLRRAPLLHTNGSSHQHKNHRQLW